MTKREAFLVEENMQLQRELVAAKQYNDLFRKCTRRALDLWLEKHPDTKMFPDTAKNLCWLAEENERLQEALRPYASPDNWFQAREAKGRYSGDGEEYERDVYVGHAIDEQAYTGARRALEGKE